MNYLSQNLTHTQETVPYTQEGEIRTFNQDTSEDELVWHRDREDRIIDPLSPTDWKFQFDNQTPVNITRLLFIPKNNLPDTVSSIKVPINTKNFKTSSDEKVIENSPGYKEEIKAIVDKLDAEYQEKGQKVNTYTLNAFGYKEDRLYIDLRTKQSDEFGKAMSRGDYGSLD